MMSIKLNRILYWLCYAGYLYIIAPSALAKIFGMKQMADSMLSLGFNQTWTMTIGLFETFGILIVLAGLFKSVVRSLGVLFLFPFAIGAFATHMAHQEYHHFYLALLMCVLSVALILLDKKIKIEMYEDNSLSTSNEI